MKGELLFEIGTEEVPAGYIAPAIRELKNILAEKLAENDLSFSAILTAATPRRLAVAVQDLPDRQPDRVDEILGPPKKAAFDAAGNPTKAALGFAASRGVAVDSLTVVTTEKGEYLMARVERTGQPTREILAQVLPECVTTLSFPKSMRWGSGSIHFARPIQWLLAILNGEPVPFTLDGLESTTATRGHRFMAPEEIQVRDFADYLEQLKTRHVVADPRERKELLLAEVAQAAARVGGEPLADDELAETVTWLVEEPHAICGRFEPRFLDLPKDVLITSMREHQKYFAVVDDKGRLMPHFVAVNNTLVKDERLGAEGHERVIRARLEDALFFFNEDRKIKLADRVERLSGVVFQAKLGTMLEKTKRLTTLATLLANTLAPEEVDTVRRASQLAKADLLTEMVGEFPSLQGIIGREYALLDGEEPSVAQAIAEHYLPVRAGGQLPSTPAGAVVAIADRLDTLAGCFGIGEKPTGTADPFGLRRQALGLIHITEAKGFRYSLSQWITEALSLYGDKLTVDLATAQAELIDFIRGRFTNDLTGQNIPVEAVEAVTSVAFDDLVDARRRIMALAAISGQKSFTLLAGAFKRVNNILKGHSPGTVNETLLELPAERDLFRAIQETSEAVAPYLAANDYDKALTIILRMKEPVDRFFDDVMVMADDPQLKANRLALLGEVARLFLAIGDFSRMYALGGKE